MKKLLLILTVFIGLCFQVNAQTYECKDINGKTFNIFITPNHYNFVLDSFIIATKLDTIITTDKYTKYVPSSNLSDTMTIFNESHIVYFSNNYGNQKTHFNIVRQLPDIERDELLNKQFILINSN